VADAAAALCPVVVEVAVDDGFAAAAAVIALLVVAAVLGHLPQVFLQFESTQLSSPQRILYPVQPADSSLHELMIGAVVGFSTAVFWGHALHDLRQHSDVVFVPERVPHGYLVVSVQNSVQRGHKVS
jgi:hypothetical protein